MTWTKVAHDRSLGIGRVQDMSETAFHGNASNSPGPWPDTTREGGWGFHAWGRVPSNKRFWVYIDDQRGNCWNP